MLREARIFAFDNHVSLAPLLQPERLHPRFAFLAEPDGYREVQESGPALASGSFAIQPLRRDLKRNYVWKAYHKILLPDNHEAALCARCWQLQIPVRCVPHDLDVAFVPSELLEDIAWHLGVEVYLCPAGWSSKLELRLRGDFAVGQLQQLRYEFAKERSIRLGDQKLSLSGVFRHLKNLLLEDLYGEARHDVDSKASLQRFLVTAILAAEQPLDPYDQTRMPESDRARLQRLLRGQKQEVDQEVDRVELWNLEHPRQFRLTWFRPSEMRDFALTDFRIGSLLSFTNSGLYRKYSRSRACAAANVCTCFRLVHHLERFYEHSAEHAKNPLVDALRQAAAIALKRLPDVYTSPYCAGLYLKGDPAHRFRNPSKAEATATPDLAVVPDP
jgi:hypothetical protein